MLEKLPDRRPKDMGEVLSELKKAQLSPVQAEIQTTLTLPVSNHSRQRVVLWTGGIAILIAATLVLKVFSADWNLAFFTHPAQLDSLLVRLPKQRLEIGETLPLKGLARYSDGSEIELDKQVQWSSTEPSILPVLPDGRIEARIPGVAGIIARVGSVSAPPAWITVLDKSPPEDPPQIRFVSVVLPREKRRLIVKEKTQLKLKATFSDDTVRDIKEDVEWQSVNSAVVNVNATGEIEALKSGNTTIIARYNGIGAEAVHIEVRDKRGDVRKLPVKKASIETAGQTTGSDTPEFVEPRLQSQPETIVKTPKVDPVESTPVVSPRDPRDVVSDYIRAEKQRRGR
jgi:hypothetical protein